MIDFEKWLKPQLPYFKPDRDLEVIVDVAFIEKAYEAGFRAASDKAATLPQQAMFDAGFERGRVAGMEIAAEIALNCWGNGESIAAAIREKIHE
jgi:hypothetical protein